MSASLLDVVAPQGIDQAHGASTRFAQGGRMRRIETQRLHLAPVSSKYEDVLLAIFQDGEVRRYLLDGRVVDRAWVRQEIESSAERFSRGDPGLFIARLRAGSEPAGVAGFRFDHQPAVLELVYALLPRFWKKGLGTEMAEAMVKLAFARGHAAVRAAVDAPNSASIRVLERLGMSIEKRSPGAFGPMLHYVLERRRRRWKRGR